MEERRRRGEERGDVVNEWSLGGGLVLGDGIGREDRIYEMDWIGGRQRSTIGIGGWISRLVGGLARDRVTGARGRQADAEPAKGVLWRCTRGVAVRCGAGGGAVCPT